jgi:hypothetical protein
MWLNTDSSPQRPSTSQPRTSYFQPSSTGGVFPYRQPPNKNVAKSQDIYSSLEFTEMDDSVLDLNTNAPLTPARPAMSSRFSSVPTTEVPQNKRGISMANPYARLKGLTKRYSLPFPVFTGSSGATRGGAVDRGVSSRRQ